MTAHRVLTVLLCLGLLGCTGRQPGGPRTTIVPSATSTTRLDSDVGPTATQRTTEAVAAAVRFVCSGQRLLDSPPTQLADVIRSMWSTSAADGAVTATVDQLAALRDRLDTGDGPTRYRQSVLATRVEEPSSAKVRVAVWWVGVLTRHGAVLPQAEWTTSLITLVAEDGEWRVQAQSSEPGPTPEMGGDSEPTTHDEFERRLAGFVDWEANR